MKTKSFFPFFAACIEACSFGYNPSPESLEWYKKLNIYQRIYLKSVSALICGIEFKSLTTLFGLRGAIGLLYEKLVIENIINEKV